MLDGRILTVPTRGPQMVRWRMERRWAEKLLEKMLDSR